MKLTYYHKGIPYFVEFSKWVDIKLDDSIDNENIIHLNSPKIMQISFDKEAPKNWTWQAK